MTFIRELIADLWYCCEDIALRMFDSTLRPYAAVLFTLLIFVPAFCGVLRRIF